MAIEAQDDIKILHITDLHFGLVVKGDSTINQVYHESLLNYVIKNFKKKVNYLIISGDLADKCKCVNEVKDWLKSLIQGLELKCEQVILCAGNHDLETIELPEYHQEKRLRFDEGLAYVRNNLDKTEDRVFKSYNNIHFEVTSQSYKFLREFNDVRFIVLNSSLLSQENRGYSNKNKEKFLSKSDPERIEEIREKYGLVYRGLSPTGEIDEKKLNDSIYSSSIRYAENLRQQLRITEEGLKSLKEINDDKLNIVVFHHPESHLHTFERFPASGIKGSGLYKFISDRGHLLVCGHTHPAMHLDIDTTGVFTRIPEFVGGPAHIAGHPPHICCYFFIKDEQWKCRKEHHILDKFGIRKIDPISISLHKGLKSDESFSDLGSIVLKNGIPATISSEKAFMELKMKMFHFLGREFEAILKNAGLKVSEISLKDHWIPIPRLKGQRQIRVHSYEVQLRENKLNIFVDIIFSDEFIEQFFIEERIRWGGLLNKRKSEELYIPICIDLLCGCMDFGDIKEHLPKIDELMKFTLSKKVYEELGIVFSNLAKFMVNLEDLKLSDFANPLARGNFFFMNSGVLESVISGSLSVNDVSLTLQYADEKVEENLVPTILAFRKNTIIA